MDLDTCNHGGVCGRVCVRAHYTNLGSETIVITHFLCGPTVVHVFASSTIALASRRPYPYEWLTAETKREQTHEFQSDGSSVFTLPAPTLQLCKHCKISQNEKPLVSEPQKSLKRAESRGEAGGRCRTFAANPVSSPVIGEQVGRVGRSHHQMLHVSPRQVFTGTSVMVSTQTQKGDKSKHTVCDSIKEVNSKREQTNISYNVSCSRSLQADSWANTL